MNEILEKIKLEIMFDQENLYKTNQGIKPLFYVLPETKIIIVGQAPGTKAQNSHLPWNDASGDLLRQWLGVSREVFYNPKFFGQMPMDFYYPGKGKSGDLPPRKDFAKKWHPKILKCVKDPKLIILVGSYAQNYYLNDKLQLTERVKKFKNYLPKYFVLCHPSPINYGWRKQNLWFNETVIPELKEVVYNILKNEKGFYMHN